MKTIRPTKKVPVLRTSIVLLVLCFCDLLHAAQELPRMTIRTYHVPPWVVIEDQHVSGIAMDDLRAFARKLPFDITIEPFPWKRAENTSRAKLTMPIALFPCTPVPERDAYFLYSEQFRSSHTVLMSNTNKLPQGKITLKQLFELQRRHLSIAVREGHILLQDLKKHGVHYETVPSIEQLMNLLLRGRVDVIFDYDKVFDDYSRSHPDQFNNREFQLNVVDKITYGFCINKHSEHAEDYRRIINDVFKQQ